MNRRTVLKGLLTLVTTAIVGQVPIYSGTTVISKEIEDKLHLIRTLLENGVRAHDDMIESVIFQPCRLM